MEDDVAVPMNPNISNAMRHLDKIPQEMQNMVYDMMKQIAQYRELYRQQSIQLAAVCLSSPDNQVAIPDEIMMNGKFTGCFEAYRDEERFYTIIKYYDDPNHVPFAQQLEDAEEDDGNDLVP